MTEHTKLTTLATEWAGYTSEGMDYQGHIHPHPEGTFFRMGDGLKGVYCAAPLAWNEETKDHECTDPNPEFFAVKGAEGDGRSSLPLHLQIEQV